MNWTKDWYTNQPKCKCVVIYGLRPKSKERESGRVAIIDRVRVAHLSGYRHRMFEWTNHCQGRDCVAGSTNWWECWTTARLGRVQNKFSIGSQQYIVGAVSNISLTQTGQILTAWTAENGAIYPLIAIVMDLVGVAVGAMPYLTKSHICTRATTADNKQGQSSRYVLFG